LETLALVVAATFVWVVSLLVIEFVRYRQGGREALITNVMRNAVHSQPWVFILLALTSGFMMGHCFGQ
jgi:hypothetical protein